MEMLAGAMVILLCAGVSWAVARETTRRMLARHEAEHVSVPVQPDRGLTIERQMENLWAYDGTPRRKEVSAYGNSDDHA